MDKTAQFEAPSPRLCPVCERGCHLAVGATGACGMYRNTGRVVQEVYPDHYLLVCPISVETMPMLHFYPAAKFLQISTMGCNFDCPGCISTVIVKEFDPACRAVRQIPPEEIIAKAQELECSGIAFLMNEPLAAFHTFMGVAKKAKEQGLMVGCASNGYFTEDSLMKLLPFLDFIHVGFKGDSDAAYVECGARTAEPVFRNVRILKDHGVHVEVSCVHKRGRDREVEDVARRIGRISRDIPFHVMRFVPLEQAAPDQEPSIRESEELCGRLRDVLRYVYLFNSPGTRLLSTVCPDCAEVVLKREFYGPMGAKIKPNPMTWDAPYRCPSCGKQIDIRGDLAERLFQEQMFEGGYPFTRALEILESILITIGVRRRNDLVKAWNRILSSELFPELHSLVQDPWGYLKLVTRLGDLVGRPHEAEALVSYMRKRLMFIANWTPKPERRLRVYYAMGKPWFCINAERMENRLVEIAGGESLNRRVTGKGRPGTEISSHTINCLNPEVIFISALFGSSLDDFYEECSKAWVDVAATRTLRVYCHPVPASDFGSPRWILGLMHIANVLQPDRFHFDVIKEASSFYKRFYHMEYRQEDVNLSFGKPIRGWAFA